MVGRFPRSSSGAGMPMEGALPLSLGVRGVSTYVINTVEFSAGLFVLIKRVPCMHSSLGTLFEQVFPVDQLQPQLPSIPFYPSDDLVPKTFLFRS